MPIRSIVRILFSILIFILLSGAAVAPVFAAPLEGGFALAPRANASPEERDRAFINARLKVIEAAKTYLGTPYRYGGMTPAALDCSGFLLLSFRDALGVALPRSASSLFTWTVRVPLERAQPGDLLFFRTNSTGNITHVGLYLGDRVFIHSASAGPRTGVIYSSLDETYWSNTYAGAGRAFPESSPFRLENAVSSAVSAGSAVSGGRPENASRSDIPLRPIHPPAAGSGGEGRLLLGVGIAPIWNGFLKGGDLLRGVSMQLCLGAETYSFGPKMVFGIELRPEYDGALGIFRLPITLSWGPNDQIRIFAGPVFSFGEATLSTENGERHYSGGTSWLGAVGVTAAPFTFKSSSGDFSPYIELAWQSYFSNNNSSDFSSDFSAGFRFSTGVRWLIHVK